jgi:hypothetical protein
MTPTLTLIARKTPSANLTNLSVRTVPFGPLRRHEPDDDPGDAEIKELDKYHNVNLQLFFHQGMPWWFSGIILA